MKPQKKKCSIREAVTVVLAITFGFFLMSCSDDDSTLRIMAAASLSDAFHEIAEAFEYKTGTKTTIYTAGSTTLATQLEEGAEADVIGLANEQTLERVIISGRVANDALVQIFATNHMVIVTPKGNPASISSFKDLPDALLAICAPAVPCGVLSYKLAERKEVVLKPTSEEPSVRSVRTKVELGEVDAGLIYITDITTNMEVIRIQDAEDVFTRYPIVVLEPPKAEAEDFVSFVVSGSGQSILEKYGFGTKHEN